MHDFGFLPIVPTARREQSFPFFYIYEFPTLAVPFVNAEYRCSSCSTIVFTVD
jgi:hypothetical protein